MSNIESETTIYPNRQNAESAELRMENKENQEGEEEKKMAARERAEQFSREVQNTKKQAQNILVNMQQVIKAVQMIRNQLGLSGGQIPSVSQDEKTLKKLQEKLANLSDQLDDLKLALEQEEKKSISEEHPDWNQDLINAETKRRVEDLLQKLDLSENKKI